MNQALLILFAWTLLAGYIYLLHQFRKWHAGQRSWYLKLSEKNQLGCLYIYNQKLKKWELLCVHAIVTGPAPKKSTRYFGQAAQQAYGLRESDDQPIVSNGRRFAFGINDEHEYDPKIPHSLRIARTKITTPYIFTKRQVPLYELLELKPEVL